MTPSELHAAILSLPSTAPSHEHAYGAYSRGFVAACHAAAELVLAAGEEDGQLVTIQWLEQIGGVVSTAPAGNKYADFLFDIEKEFRTEVEVGRSWLRLHDPINSSEWRCDPEVYQTFEGREQVVGLCATACKHRADVLTLCRALGIQLRTPVEKGK